MAPKKDKPSCLNCRIAHSPIGCNVLSRRVASGSKSVKACIYHMKMRKES